MTGIAAAARSLAAPLAVAVAALVAAGLARYRLVEPSDLTAICDRAPWDGLVCALRTLTVQMFAGHRIGLVALAAALAATLTRRRGLALAALGSGAAALVLYSVALGAPAVLLALLVLVRSRGPAR